MQSFFACRGGYYPPEVISVTAEHPSIDEIKISILPVGVDALDDPFVRGSSRPLFSVSS